MPAISRRTPDLETIQVSRMKSMLFAVGRAIESIQPNSLRKNPCQHRIKPRAKLSPRRLDLPVGDDRRIRFSAEPMVMRRVGNAEARVGQLELSVLAVVIRTGCWWLRYRKWQHYQSS